VSRSVYEEEELLADQNRNCTMCSAWVEIAWNEISENPFNRKRDTAQKRYFVLQVKCHSLLTIGRQTYVFCRAWAQSSRFGVSGKSLE